MGEGPENLGEIVVKDDRELTMAELKAAAERELDDGDETPPAHELVRTARPRERDDELLDDPPATKVHLGRFAGWHAVRKLRWIITASLGLALTIGIIVFVHNTRELRHQRLHPLPEVEATIAPGTPRDMTISEGNMRVGLSREAPAINLLHLPDRDITLARGAEKAQFKVEVRDGETVEIKVLTGEIVETLTKPDARPLLD
ncbi:hypothetical protein ENSA5_21570 [Enhygromyxa salina]|uniref:Uncharacterized protein n=1 Tax=Enhygromyxa salina TaxID=215803 RepID=A0A2S9YBS7_9BACT|nr:hypothetical protein [Enhygromyxa salina]PRQ02512.1 hypothetical protein ENSA5_21570 [Enhygromyxa salina]